MTTGAGDGENHDHRCNYEDGPSTDACEQWPQRRGATGR